MFDEDYTSSSQAVISFELLNLIKWILTHEPEGLKRLINRAVIKGLAHDGKGANLQPVEDMQQCVTDFLASMENLLFESINKHLDKQTRETNLVPSAHRIDTTVCDSNTIHLSLQKASSKIGPHDNPQDLLLKELLKRWKPNKGHLTN